MILDTLHSIAKLHNNGIQSVLYALPTQVRENATPGEQGRLAEIDAAVDRVLALLPPAKAKEKQQRIQRKTGHPPPAQASKNITKPAVR